MADDPAFEAAVQAQLAAMRRYVTTHGEMPPSHTHAHAHAHAHSPGRTSAPPASAPAHPPMHEYASARTEARGAAATPPAFSWERASSEPPAPVRARTHAHAAAASRVVDGERGGGGDVLARADAAPAARHSSWDAPPAAFDTPRTSARVRASAYASALEQQVEERRAQKEREREREKELDDDPRANAGAWPWEKGAVVRSSRRRSVVSHVPPPSSNAGSGPGGLSDVGTAMEEQAARGDGMHRRPSRYRDMSVGLIAAVDALPAPRVSSAQPRPNSVARSPVSPPGAEMPANMDAEAVSKAVRAGHVFTRYRFDRLPQEEQERVMAAQRSREAQAAELAAQITEQRAAKERQAREAAARAAAEEAQLAREQSELRRRQLVEMEADRNAMQAAKLPGASGGDALGHRVHGDMSDDISSTLLPASARNYPTTRERLLALRQVRMTREGVGGDALGGREDARAPSHATRSTDGPTIDRAYRDVSDFSAHSSAIPAEERAPALHVSPPRASPSLPRPAGSPALVDTWDRQRASLDDVSRAPMHATEAHAQQYSASGWPLAHEHAPSNAFNHAALGHPAPGVFPPPHMPRDDGMGGGGTMGSMMQPGTHAAWGILPDAFLHRMRYALAELEAAAAAVPLVRGGAVTALARGASLLHDDHRFTAPVEPVPWAAGVMHPVTRRSSAATGYDGQHTGPGARASAFPSAGGNVPLEWRAGSQELHGLHTDASAGALDAATPADPEGDGDLTWVGSDRPMTAAPSDVRSSSAWNRSTSLRGKWAQSFDQAVVRAGAPTSPMTVPGPTPPEPSVPAGTDVRADVPIAVETHRTHAPSLVEQSLDSSTLLVYLEGARAASAAGAATPSLLEMVREDEAEGDDREPFMVLASTAASVVSAPNQSPSTMGGRDTPDAAVADTAQVDDGGAPRVGDASDDTRAPESREAPQEPSSAGYDEDVFEEDAPLDAPLHVQPPNASTSALARVASSPLVVASTSNVDSASTRPATAHDASSAHEPDGPRLGEADARPSADVLATSSRGSGSPSHARPSSSHSMATRARDEPVAASPKNISFAEIQAALDGMPSHVPSDKHGEDAFHVSAPPTMSADVAAVRARTLPVTSIPDAARPPSASTTTARSPSASITARSRPSSAVLGASAASTAFPMDATADLSTLDSTGKYARRQSWGLGDTEVEQHKRRLLAFYTLHAPAKAHKENVDHAWQLFGPRIWEELEHKYKGKTLGFRPAVREAVNVARVETGK